MSKVRPESGYLTPGREADMESPPDYAPRFPGSGRLAGKTAIITGADSGIGRAVAVLFAREGARVAIGYYSEDEDAEATADMVRQEGSEAMLFKGDVGNRDFCFESTQRAVEAFGGLDILINNAAEQHVRDDLTEVSEEELARTFRTNFFGYFFMVQAALPHLKGGGTIINTASVVAYEGHPALVDYASTKGAIVAYTRSLSRRLAPDIRVNAVAPGPIWTPLIPATFPEEKVENFGRNTPLGRPGQPNEVAPAYLFLASADGSYFTGQALHPDGGRFVSG